MFFQVSQSERIIDMTKSAKESLIVISALAGFLPLMFALACMPSHPEAALYWLKTAITFSIVAPIVGFIIDRVWRKIQK